MKKKNVLLKILPPSIVNFKNNLSYCIYHLYQIILQMSELVIHIQKLLMIIIEQLSK